MEKRNEALYGEHYTNASYDAIFKDHKSNPDEQFVHLGTTGLYSANSKGHPGRPHEPVMYFCNNEVYDLYLESQPPPPYQESSLGIDTQAYSNQQPTSPPKYTRSPPRLREQQRTANITQTDHHSNGKNLFILSIVLTILCIFCGGWYALLCTIPAIVIAKGARGEYKSGNVKGAKKKRKCAICFITVSVFTYAMVAALIATSAIYTFLLRSDPGAASLEYAAYGLKPSKVTIASVHSSNITSSPYISDNSLVSHPKSSEYVAHSHFLLPSTILNTDSFYSGPLLPSTTSVKRILSSASLLQSTALSMDTFSSDPLLPTTSFSEYVLSSTPLLSSTVLSDPLLPTTTFSEYILNSTPLLPSTALSDPLLPTTTFSEYILNSTPLLPSTALSTDTFSSDSLHSSTILFEDASSTTVSPFITPTPSPLSFQDVQERCIDHFLAARYDGSGGVYVAGAEPSGYIHTSRGDCNGLPQGWQLIFQFDIRGRSSVSISVSGTALGRTCTGNIVTGTAAAYEEVFTSCSWGEGGAQFPIVTTFVSVT